MHIYTLKCVTLSIFNALVAGEKCLLLFCIFFVLCLYHCFVFVQVELQPLYIYDCPSRTEVIVFRLANAQTYIHSAAVYVSRVTVITLNHCLVVRVLYIHRKMHMRVKPHTLSVLQTNTSRLNQQHRRLSPPRCAYSEIVILLEPVFQQIYVLTCVSIYHRNDRSNLYRYCKGVCVGEMCVGYRIIDDGTARLLSLSTIYVCTQR